jgi:hypothetical protein
MRRGTGRPAVVVCAVASNSSFSTVPDGVTSGLASCARRMCSRSASDSTSARARENVPIEDAGGA